MLDILKDHISFDYLLKAASSGFGSVCTLATVAFPFFTSAAVVALLYPLFILIAGDADPKPAYKQGKRFA